MVFEISVISKTLLEKFAGGDTLINIERLLYRRQFVIGPKQFSPNRFWSSIKLLDQLYLSVHIDLPLNSNLYGGIKVILIGHAYDPFHPNYREEDIMNSLTGKFTDLMTFINATSHLAGRWVIIFQSNEGIYIFTDPCGFRQVFYASDGNQFCCASQPELINTNLELFLDTDDDLINFLLSKDFAREESAWIGSRTIYKGCYHLLPNHYLELNSFKQVRFFPLTFNTIEENKVNETIEFVAIILKGTMAAIINRNNIAMALTSGWDSRILLAATKELSSNIEYFIDRKGVIPKYHPDVRIPKRMAKRLKIKFTILNSNYDLPGWFVYLLSKNVTGARVLPKTKMIFNSLINENEDERLYVKGNGGEIFRLDEHRKSYEKIFVSTSYRCNSDVLVRYLGHESVPVYALNEILNWRKDIDLQQINGISILDLLYWEQRLGNWGSLFPAEQDIAAEEISPYNCRLLIETLLSCPKEKRSAPDYQLYQKLMKIMWPEVLRYPINPGILPVPFKKFATIYHTISSKLN
jgi:hypothetical protein